MLLLATCALPAEVLKFGPERKGLAAVADPAAGGKRAVAINVETDSGKLVIGTLKKPLAPGLYRFNSRVRLHLPSDYDAARLRLTLAFVVDGKAVAQAPLNWPHFNSRPGTYTEFTQTLSFTQPAVPSVELSWAVAPLPAGEKPRFVRPQKGPSIDDANKKTEGKGKGGNDLGDLGDLVGELQADVAVPLASITYPAVLADQLTFTAESTTLAVEKVWPEKVHVFPGEANPIEVTVRNYSPRPETALVRLEVRTGLGETIPPQETQLTVPGGGSAQHRFAWTAGKREFGHEAHVTLVADGKPGHEAAEYFTVGAPIWKTAIQGSGFLTWFGREPQFPEHVESNRRAYVNVEEAFSWQPSSWTDLNPAGEDWWTGQGNAHNSLKGLRLWMGLSHTNGIKLITYSWPSASGPAGIEWGRKHPDLVTHVQVGLASEFHDVEDLRLYDLLHTNAAYKGYQYGVWHGFGINRGYLNTINLGAEEIIQSARRFGWDGVRFDSPPGWSAMGAEDVHEEFARMKVADQMAKLVPEFYGVKTGNWDETAISIRNVRWLRHRFTTEIGKPFALSYNYGVNVETGGKAGRPPEFFRECCKEGGQVMHEAIRQSGSWEAYRKTALQQAEIARQNGGFHTVFAPDRGAEWGRNFAAIFTFASGSHSYGNYGWGPKLAGAYSQFMTRYGEYCWDLALAPVAGEQAGIAVRSEATLLWQDYVRHRTLPGGATQTVLHLITPPPVDGVNPAGKNGTFVPWQKEVVAKKAGARKPVVWLLSAEPTTRAELLPVRAEGDGFAVTVPEHRLWSVLVWTEGKE
ncbi:MAG: hypothetical protein EBS05_12655 [Proteobacteria bacterium]|nr:hypothetical protein [Pseudomonadota bacterium]